MPKRPPKDWWDKMYKEVKEGNPSYSDETVRETVGDIWYNKMSPGKKRKEVKKEKGSLRVENITVDADMDDRDIAWYAQRLGSQLPNLPEFMEAGVQSSSDYSKLPPDEQEKLWHAMVALAQEMGMGTDADAVAERSVLWIGGRKKAQDISPQEQEEYNLLKDVLEENQDKIPKWREILNAIKTFIFPDISWEEPLVPVPVTAKLRVAAHVQKKAVIRKCKEGDAQEDKPWCLYTHDGKKLLGRHPSKESAVKQEQAIKAQGTNYVEAISTRIPAAAFRVESLTIPNLLSNDMKKYIKLRTQMLAANMGGGIPPSTPEQAVAYVDRAAEEVARELAEGIHPAVAAVIAEEKQDILDELVKPEEVPAGERPPAPQVPVEVEEPIPPVGASMRVNADWDTEEAQRWIMQDEKAREHVVELAAMADNTTELAGWLREMFINNGTIPKHLNPEWQELASAVAEW
jgi:hypothetical protein